MLYVRRLALGIEAGRFRILSFLTSHATGILFPLKAETDRNQTTQMFFWQSLVWPDLFYYYYCYNKR
jgi:hypothetical protein